MLCFHQHIPSGPLGDYVALFWYFEGSVTEPRFERLLPTGTVELVIDLNEERVRVYDGDDTARFDTYRGPLVCGVHSDYFVIDAVPNERIAGIHFKPGGAWPFLGVPVDETHNSHLELSAVWGSAADDLREQLLAARSPGEMFALMERALIAASAGRLDGHPAVRYALRRFAAGPGMESIGQVTDAVGYSDRRFIELFRRQVGLTPKLFCRVLRFQQVLQRIAHGACFEWAEVALACGYYDQSHFIRDFRAFSGLNPSAYMLQRGEHANHVPLAV